LLGERVPAERLHGISAVSANVRIKIVEVGRVAVAFAGEQHRLLDARMAQQEPDQLKSGIAAGPDHGAVAGGVRPARDTSRRVCRLRAFLLSGAMMRMVSSPATVPTTSSHPSASTATATGCALPEIVLMTSRFCARRTSRTNSRTTRETVGKGSTVGSSAG